MLLEPAAATLACNEQDARDELHSFALVRKMASKSDTEEDSKNENRMKCLHRKFVEELEDHDAEMRWKPQRYDTRCPRLAYAVTSMPFEIVCSIMVIFNMVTMTLYYDWSISSPSRLTSFFASVETAFCTWYLTELVLRVLPFGLRVFIGPEMKWYVFDAVLVAFSVLGELYPHATGDADPLRISKVIKLLRLLRASRMLKLARILKSSVQFGLLIKLMGSALGCFFWACVISVVTTYTFSLITVSQVSDFTLTASPDSTAKVIRYFGSVPRTMLTSFMAVSGGIDWHLLIDILEEVGLSVCATFVTYVLLSTFLILNLTLAMFLQVTLKAIYNNDRETLKGHMMQRNLYVNALRDVFGGDYVTWPMYRAEESNPKLRWLLQKVLKIERSQARKLFQILSGNGKHSVEIQGFVVGCINMKRSVTIMDLMEVELMHSDSIDEQTNLVMACLSRSKTLTSTATKFKIEQCVAEVSPASFEQILYIEARKAVLQLDVPGGKSTVDSFLHTVRRVAHLSLQAEGGCGFVIAPAEAFQWLQDARAVDFQVVDRSEKYPTGYMTKRLKGVHVDDKAFLQAVQDLSQHSDSDRWPEGHEAGGLPKDGYILVSAEGLRVLCAARMIGLPTPPYSWDGVGTRHMAAVAAAHALSRFPCCVIVRSDSGKVHGLCPQIRKKSIKVIGCRLHPAVDREPSGGASTHAQ